MDDFKVRVSAELEKNAGKQIQDGLNKVTPKPIEVPFKIDFKNSKEIENEMKRIVSKLTNGKGSLADFKINTSTIFDKDLGQRVEKINSALIKYKNELGEVISEQYKFNKIGSNIDGNGKEEAIMGWSKAMSTYGQNIEQVTKKEEALAKKQQASMMKQKELVEQMKLLQIQANKSGTTLNQDNLTGFDTANKNNNIKEMTHYLKLAKTEYSQFNAMMEKDLPISGLENMKKNIGTMPIDIQNVETSFKKLQVQPEELRTRIDQLGNSFKSLENFKGAEADKVKQYNLLKNEITGVTKEVKSLISVQQQQISLDDKTKFSYSITSWSNDNTKGAKLFRVELERIQRELVGADKTKFTALKKEFGSIQKQTEAMGKSGRTAFQEIGNNFKKFASWYGIAGVVTSAVRGVKQMVSTVIELDQSLVDLQQATGFTAEETGKLLNTYIDLGQELGTTGTEVAQAADVWLRQGKSLAETNTLIRDSMILSKIGQVDSAKATQYLTSAMKGYKLEASEVLSVIDRMASVDLSSATSIGGLAEAMSRTATGASMAGIEMDKLLGMLAVVGEVTQKSMDSIGESFKTIFARMGNVKLGKFVDEDGNDITTEINDVEKILNKVDIKLRDSATSFRNFGDVLDDVGGSWSDFNEVEQNAIANAFAGVRQRENFNVLMENYGDSLKYAEISANSAGTAMEKFSAYEESVEAKTKRLQASLQELATDTLDSSVVKGFLDLSNMLINVTDKVGLFNIAIIALMTALNVKKGTVVLGWLSKLTGALGLATGASTTLGLALSAIIPTALILGGFTLITKGLDAITTTLEEQKEALETANTAYEESKTKLESINSELKTTEERISALEAKDNLTFVEDGELQKLKDITAELLIQQDIQQRKKDEDAKILAETASDTFKKQFGDKQWNFTTPEQQISDEQSAFDMYGTSYEDESSIYKLIAAYKELNELTSEALQKEHLYGDDSQKELDDYAKSLDEVNTFLTSNLDDLKLQKANMQDYYDVIKNTPYDELNSEQKAIYDNYNAISSIIELIYTNIDPSKWKEIKFTEVFNSPEMSKAKTELENLAKSGELTTSTITSNEEYKRLLDETGLSAEEVVNQIKAITISTDEATNGANNLTNAFTEAQNKSIDAYQKSLSTIKTALSADDLDSSSIIDLMQEFSDFSWESFGVTGAKGIGDLNGALKELARRQYEALDPSLKTNEAFKQMYEDTLQASKGIVKLTDDVTKKMQTDEEFYKAVIKNLDKNTKKQAELYDINFNDYKSLLEAKLALDKEYALRQQDLTNAEMNFRNVMYGGDIEQKKQMFANWNEAQSALDAYVGLTTNFSTSLRKTAKDYGKKGKKTDPIKDAFDAEYNTLKYNLDKQLITEAEYYNAVEKLNKKYYANKKKYLDDFRKYDVEVLKGRQKLEEESIKSKFDDLSHSFAMGDIKTEESYQKQRWELAKKYYKNNKDYLDEWEKAQEEWYKWNLEQAEETAKKQEKIAENLKDKYSDLIGEIADEVKKEKDDVLDSLDESHKRTIKNLEEQKDNYKEIVETQLDLLDAKKKQNDYEESITNKTKEISKIESRKAELEKAAKSGDRTAIAELAKLDEELSSKKEDLLDEQSDHEFDLQKESLNNALDLNDRLMDARIDAENTRFETQKSNIEKLYDEEIKLINNAAQHTKEEFGRALDEIAVQLASNGIAQSSDYLGVVKKSQSSIAGSQIDTSTANRSAILAILSNGTGKDYKEEASALASYTRDNYGAPISKKQGVEVAKLLGVSGINSVNDLTGNDENKNKILEALRKAGFSKGGYVDASMIKRVGEDGIAFVKNGEPILTVEQGKLFKELVNNIKPLNNLVKLSTPNLSGITNNNNSPNINIPIIIQGNATPSTVSALNNAGNNIVKQIMNEVRKL